MNQALASHKPGDIDWVTFVGSGETCLHAEIGWLIRQVKATTHLPVAVITNGSLLYVPKVRQALSPADVVLPSLNAGTPDLYRRVNRTHPTATFQGLLDGLVRFRQEYQGKLWIEVMMVRGLNDTEQALRDIAVALKRIRPDQVHILQPTRSPAENWVQPADEDALLGAMAILGSAAQVIHLSTGLVVGYQPRPYIHTFINFLEARYDVKVVVGTHPIPKKYLDRHTHLGTWKDPAWRPLVRPTLSDEPTQIKYN
jgi:wyosine [tRNA(Phe)-imidazoG37] synthetase (radical SAM superfamily)